jgi:hypothetical protein
MDTQPKVYTGSRAPGRGAGGTAIIVTAPRREYPLPFVDQWEHGRRAYDDHSPVPDSPEYRRHEWGYRGSGPADTAASILFDYLGEPAPRSLVQKFKAEHVATLPRWARWTITGQQVQAFLDRHAALIARERAAVAEYQQFKTEEDPHGQA